MKVVRVRVENSSLRAKSGGGEARINPTPLDKKGKEEAG